MPNLESNKRTGGEAALQPAGQRAARSFESKVVQHCAPTLAGVKPANLFNCPTLCGAAFRHECAEHGAAVASCRAKIAQGGVSLAILLQRQTGALVFVYRIDQVARMLAQSLSRSFLAARGYDTSSPHAAIRSLRERMERHECSRGACERCEFPHEVGLFLGYPYDDVMAFIARGGAAATCTGAWQAYSDEQAARDTFECYKRHTRLFVEMFESGTPIEELAKRGRGVERCA